jgi:hypothetical protein
VDQVLREGPTPRTAAAAAAAAAVVVVRGAPPRLGHFGIVVGDMERSLGFYCDLLGFEVDEYLQSASPTGRDIDGQDDLRRRVVILRVEQLDQRVRDAVSVCADGGSSVNEHHEHPRPGELGQYSGGTLRSSRSR